MANNGINFVYFDYNKNATVVLRGSVRVRDGTSGGGDHVNANASSPPPPDGRPYDERGALWYVIVVIFVYSLSMLCLVAMLIRRKGKNKTIDSEVTNFLKGLDGARQRAIVESVLRVRLKWPGNFINPRYSARPEGGNNNGELSEWSLPERRTSASGSLYTLIPATTIPPEAAGSGSAREHPSGCCVAPGDDGADAASTNGTLQVLEVDFPKDYRPRNASGRTAVTRKVDERAVRAKSRPEDSSTTLAPVLRVDTSRLNQTSAERNHPDPEICPPDRPKPISGKRRSRTDRSSGYAAVRNPDDDKRQASSDSGSSSTSKQLSDELGLSDVEGLEISYDTDSET